MKDNYEIERTCPTGSFAYTIKSGDTLFQLARRFNTTVEGIMAINPGIDPNNLQIGQVICIPKVTAPLPPCPNGFYYTIKSGDTLYNLSQRFNIPLQEIINANPGIDPNRLQIGQVICIPQPVPYLPPCPEGVYYVVKAGDTLFSIGQKFNIPLQEIIKSNPGIDPNRLQIGQIICIPRRCVVFCF